MRRLADVAHKKVAEFFNVMQNGNVGNQYPRIIAKSRRLKSVAFSIWK